MCSRRRAAVVGERRRRRLHHLRHGICLDLLCQLIPVGDHGSRHVKGQGRHGGAWRHFIAAAHRKASRQGAPVRCMARLHSRRHNITCAAGVAACQPSGGRRTARQGSNKLWVVGRAGSIRHAKAERAQAGPGSRFRRMRAMQGLVWELAALQPCPHLFNILLRQHLQARTSQHRWRHRAPRAGASIQVLPGNNGKFRNSALRHASRRGGWPSKYSKARSRAEQAAHPAALPLCDQGTAPPPAAGPWPSAPPGRAA